MPIQREVVLKKIEDAKVLVDGLSKDLQGLLSMAQMSIPLGETVVRHFSERAKQIHQLLSIERKPDA